MRDTIHAALTVRDPTVCSALLTPAFVNQTQIGRGTAALQACRGNIRTGRPARETQISGVSVTGTRARARVTPVGGDDDGATFDLRLVHRGGSWKLDRITGAKLRFERYLRATRRALRRPPNALSAGEAGCVLQRARTLGKARLERAIVNGSEVIARDALLPCLSLASLSGQLDAGIRRGLRGRVDVPCVLAQLHRTIGEQELRAIAAATLVGRPPPESLTRDVARAVIACGSSAGAGARTS